MISEAVFIAAIKKVVTEQKAIWDAVGGANIELRKINAKLHDIREIAKKRAELLEEKKKETEEYKFDEKDLQEPAESLGETLEKLGAPVKKKCIRCGETIEYALKICEECTKTEKIDLTGKKN